MTEEIKLKKEELIAYAEDNNIELGDAKTKDEILEVIKNQVQHERSVKNSVVFN